MRAVIVGGGVAGPALGLALQRAGIESVLLERRAEADPDAGSYFTVSPNGLDALDAVGALHLAREAGFASRRNTMYGATGRLLGRLSLGVPLDDATVALTMKRSRLAVLLAEEAERRGVEVRRGARVVSVAGGADGVSATLEDGTTVHGDVLVGADGVHSLVRRTIDPDAPAGRYVGLTNFGGITRSTPLAATLEPEAWHFVFGSRAFTGAHPTPDGDVVWFANVPRDEISREERASTSDEQWQDWLLDLVREDAGPAAELIRHGQLELAGDNTYDLPHVPTWSRDAHGRDRRCRPRPLTQLWPGCLDGARGRGRPRPGAAGRARRPGRAGGVRDLAARAGGEDRRGRRTQRQLEDPRPDRSPSPGGRAAARLPLRRHREEQRLDVGPPDRLGPAPERLTGRMVPVTTTGLLLAAGAGRRMGKPKALVDGWLVHAVETLGGCDRIVVVLGAGADQARPLLDAQDVTIVVNPDWAEGMGSSLSVGLAHLEHGEAARCLVTLVDLPDVGPDVVRRLLDQPDTGDVLARAAYDGTPGHPVLIGRDHWTGVIGSAMGDQGARSYLGVHDVALVECGDLATGRDVDRPTEGQPAPE